MAAPLLYFNGINGSTGGYFRAPMSAAALARQIEPRAPEELWSPKGVVSGVKPESLAEAGWGVIFPHDVGAEIEAALAPLLELRRCQAEEGGRNLYRRLQYRPRESWLQFLQRYGVGPGPVDPAKLPYYLLIVGGPVEIPFEFQYQVDVPYAVGRLSFESAEDYARYAETAVAAERGEIGRPCRAALFGVHNRDDPATRSSLENLVEPLAAALERDVGGWEVRSVLREEASKDRLRRLVGGVETPALLFTAGHALCFHPKDKALLTNQGALLCDDWPGPEQWPGRNPPEHFFAARDVSDDVDLRGLVSFHFACFSAGTPRRDSFSRAGGEAIRVIAPRPFVAALPRRLLAHPRGGALAFVGHVDQAWPHSFVWEGAGRQIEAFESAFKDLMAGKPVGLALESFAQRHATIATAVTDQMLAQRDPDVVEVSEDERARLRAYLWMSHNDARSYVVLGDPAVCLPVSGNETPAERSRF